MVGAGRNGNLFYLLLGLMLYFIGLLSFAPPAGALFTLHVDGRAVEGDQLLYPLDSGVGLSVAVLVEELGFAVDEAAFPVVELRWGPRHALLVVGDKQALVDGEPVSLVAPPKKVDGMLFIPLTLVTQLARLRADLDLAHAALRMSGAGRRPVIQDQLTVGEAPPPGPAVPVAEEPLPGSDPVLPVSAESPAGPGTTASPGSAGSSGSGSHPISLAADRPDAEHWAGDMGEWHEDAGFGLPGQTPAIVQEVQLVHDDGHVQLEVFTDRPVAPQVMFLDGPARLVVDIDGAVSATGWRVQPGDGRIVEQVRINGAEEGGVRIVADLHAPTGYTLLAPDGSGSEEAGFKVGLRLNHPLQLLGAETSDTGGVVLRLATTGPVPYRVFPLREPDRIVLDLFGVTIPGAEEVVLPGPWASVFRLSQFEQTTARAVFSVREGSVSPWEVREGVLEPGWDGVAGLALDEGGLVRALPGLGPTPPARASEVQFVGFARQDDLEFILIRAEAPLDIHVSRLRGPDRIVLDLPGQHVARSLGLTPAETEVVKAVRAGQADEAAARIVAETFGIAEHYLVLSPDRRRAVLGLRPSGLAGRTIVVDPGHGGKDPGAIGHSGSYEKDVTLSIALLAAEQLGRAGAKVVLTRDRDMTLSLAERAQMANVLGADAFVSIHADAIGFGRIASGTSTFYHPENGNDSKTSINRQYAMALQQELLQELGLPDRGVHERRFHVVLNTRMPSALVEVGFIDNPTEEQMLLDPEFQGRAAAAVAEGIVRFFGEQAAQSQERMRQWQARTELAAGGWLDAGVAPRGATALEPAPVATVARVDGRVIPRLDVEPGPGSFGPEM